MPVRTRTDGALANLADLLSRAEEPNALLRAASPFFARFGATALNYVYRPPLGLSPVLIEPVMFEHGYPDDWAHRHARENLATCDPAVRIAALTGDPVWWPDIRADPRLDAAERCYLDRAWSVRLTQGLTVPVFGPDGHASFLAMPIPAESRPSEKIDIHFLESGVRVLHRRFIELLAGGITVPTLSPRERDVLQWIARGKSNAIIAEILGVSPNTVDTYVRRVFLKLNATDRTTATLRAVAFGLVS